MRRFFLFLGTLAMVIGFLKLTPGAGQAPTASAQAGAVAKAGPAIKTAWGEPDLQGIWLDPYMSPFERPARYAGREFFTDAERAALDAQRAKRLGSDFRPPESVVAAAKGTGATGTYSEVHHFKRPTGPRTSLIVDPPDGRMPPVTPAVTKRRAEMREFQLTLLQATLACKNKLPACAGGKYGSPSPRFEEPAPIYPRTGVNRSDGPEDHGMHVRCLGGYLPAGSITPGFLETNSPDVHRIVQTPGGISMFYEGYQGEAWQRNIVMNGSPHLPSNVRQWWGDSRGHWEGNTLVIDVTNFSPKTDFLGARENLHLVERWTRTSPDTLEYVVTMDDPTTWTKPWTVKQEFTKQPEEANRIYSDNRCHEGNYGLPGLLRGARAEDKAFAEGRGPHPAAICTNGCGPAGGGEEGDDVRTDQGTFENFEIR